MEEVETIPFACNSTDLLSLLRGFDQFMNLVVDDAHETTNEKGDKQPIGQVVRPTTHTTHFTLPLFVELSLTPLCCCVVVSFV